LKLDQASIKASFIRRLIYGEFVLMHVSTPKENTLNACYDVLLHIYCTVNNLLSVLKLGVLLQNFIRSLT